MINIVFVIFWLSIISIFYIDQSNDIKRANANKQFIEENKKVIEENRKSIAKFDTIFKNMIKNDSILITILLRELDEKIK